MERDALRDQERSVTKSQYEARLLNLALFNPPGLQSHVMGEDTKSEIVEEDPVFKVVVQEMSDEAMRTLGVGPYSEVPAISPIALKRGTANE